MFTRLLGRALEWHSRGHRFDPDRLHQKEAGNQRFPASYFIPVSPAGLNRTAYGAGANSMMFNDYEVLQFESIGDFKWCMECYGEVEFIWKGKS